MNNNRRDFLRQAGMLGLGMMTPPFTQQAFSVPKQPFDAFKLPSPTLTQQAWMDLKRGLFVHFGINTYYDKEWSMGDLDPVKFDPAELDTDQWCRVAKEAGLNYVVLITKHHDGFCLWPTKYTDYSVSASPFKGDVVGELVNSANKYGLKVGFYYSLWDNNNRLHDANEDAYVEWMMGQLEELCTQYGPLVELWFDGFWKKQQSGWTKKIDDSTGEKVERAKGSRDEDFVNAWRMEGAYRWQMDRVYKFIKSMQPDCMVMNNSTSAYPGVPLHPVDARCGEKHTSVVEDKKVWNWLGKDIYLPLQIETTLSVKGNEKFPSGNWFWHEWDHSVASKKTLLNYLDVAEKMNANLLLNVGPSDKGKLRPEDEKALLGLSN